MSCEWEYLKKGKTHDLYGLLVLMIMSIIEMYYGFSEKNMFNITIWLIVFIISEGIFVDLWSHCFHH